MFVKWKKDLKEDTQVTPTFHYISGSPWPLYSSIQDFIAINDFPQGTIDMRRLDFSKHKDFFDLGNAENIDTYRLNRIYAIMSTLPKKQFILIGDSTQRDAEIFAQAFKFNKSKVKCIFIRKVSGVDEEKEETLNKKRRFEKIFEDVPEDSWYVFEDFEDLEKIKFSSATCRPVEKRNWEFLV